MNDKTVRTRREDTITSKIMTAVKGKNTRLEIAIRKALFARGLRFRKNFTGLPGRPDIVFLRRKLAVFIDGDFWHGNAWKVRGYRSLEDMFPPDKRGFWIPKIEANIERDKQVNTELQALGWETLRFWESDVERDFVGCVDVIYEKVRKANDSFSVKPSDF